MNAAAPVVVYGTVSSLKRGPMSTVGNPSYWVTLTNERGEIVGSYRTATNSGLAYGISNPEYARVRHAFTLNSRGQIIKAKPAPLRFELGSVESLTHALAVAEFKAEHEIDGYPLMGAVERGKFLADTVRAFLAGFDS